VWALHRYVKGDGADWNLGILPWTPPGGIALLVGVYAVAGVALTWSLRDSAPQHGHRAER